MQFFFIHLSIYLSIYLSGDARLRSFSQLQFAFILKQNKPALILSIPSLSLPIAPFPFISTSYISRSLQLAALRSQYYTYAVAFLFPRRSVPLSLFSSIYPSLFLSHPLSLSLSLSLPLYLCYVTYMLSLCCRFFILSEYYI